MEALESFEVSITVYRFTLGNALEEFSFHQHYCGEDKYRHAVRILLGVVGFGVV